MPDDYEERAVYVVEGGVEIAGTYFDASRMLSFQANDSIALRAGPRGFGCCCWVVR
jgi:redox-sensitive bicupin YhaK (pirin superfamily)